MTEPDGKEYDMASMAMQNFNDLYLKKEENFKLEGILITTFRLRWASVSLIF